MRPRFSEFTYGFAVTYELVESVREMLPGPPLLPSLAAEGSLGYDVRMDGLEGWTFLAQFKVPHRMVRPSALQWPSWLGPYYRFSTEDDSEQHELLTNLEAQSIFNMVVYMAPCFTDPQSLSQHFNARSLESASLKIRPSVIGQGDHVITFDEFGACLVHSEPRAVPVVTAALAHSEAPVLGSRIRFSPATIHDVTESLLEVVETGHRADRVVRIALDARRRGQRARSSETAEAFADLEVAARLTVGAQVVAVPTRQA